MTAAFTPQTLRFVSYNIRKAMGIDRRRNPHRILEVLNHLDADVVVLQEADKRLGNRPTAVPVQMIDKETDFEILPIAHNDVSLGWHGNAVLVRKGITTKGMERITLPGLEPRGAVLFELELAKRSVAVIGTHLGLLRRYRRRQLQTIARRVDAIDNVIILGDFNEWSLRRGLEPLSPKFTVLNPGRSFHTARPVATLDRIAHSGNIIVKDAGVGAGKLAQRASDHLPIWADIALP